VPDPLNRAPERPESPFEMPRDSSAERPGDISAHLAERVPRYTSYPTAPHFSPAVGGETYRGWLAALPETARLSLYLHVPFCRKLCWYCGCHTKVAVNREPVDFYLALLETEIDLVARSLGATRPAVHLHWGGGTPTIVGPGGFARMMAHLRRRFAVDAGAEVAVEIDPRRLDAEMADALAAAGVTRASLGVQSFDPKVQGAINRIQSLEQTAAAAALLRAAGIGRINIDLLYGLPHETQESCRETVTAVLGLAPDRLAVFGYAHVPAMKRHQRLIDAAALPGPAERFRQERTIAEVLVGAGFRRIGLDHYARAGDALAVAQAEGRLRRNFQGYTDDPADALIGFGASAIGELPQGYVQNTADLPAWRRAVEEGRLATARGIALDADDRLRREVIERLMCDLRVDVAAVLHRHGLGATALDGALAALAPMAADGLVDLAGRTVIVPEGSRPLLRCVAAAFDAYLDPAAGRHAVAV